jgi:hypothetical protein
MRARDKRAQDLLVSAMDAVEDADGQPGVMQADIVEGMRLLHGKGDPPGRPVGAKSRRPSLAATPESRPQR